MRVSFNTGNVRELRSFLNLDSNFITVLITESIVYLISEKIGVYSHKMFKVISRENFREVSFRVDRKEFLGLLVEGTVTVYINPSATSVHLSFSNGVTEYSMERPYQISNLSTIMDKLDLLGKERDFTRLNLSSISRYMRLVRALSPITSVKDGYLFAADDNISLYAQVDCENVNLFTDVASYVLAHSEVIRAYKKFIIGTTDTTAIVVEQVVNSMDARNDIKFVKGPGMSHKITSDFSSVCLLLKKSSAGETISLDFDRGNASFSDDDKRISFGTKFEVKEMVVGKEINLKPDDDFSELLNMDLSSSGSAVSLDAPRRSPLLMFPTKLFRDLLGSSSRSNVVVKIKKNFVTFEIGKELLLVTRRKEAPKLVNV